MTKITLSVLSGVEDGTVREFNREDDGKLNNKTWSISIGRREDNDLILRKDTFISRTHAAIHQRSAEWFLEDQDSTNGTFIENSADFLSDTRVRGEIPLTNGQLFRVGRTWLRFQAMD